MFKELIEKMSLAVASEEIDSTAFTTMLVELDTIHEDLRVAHDLAVEEKDFVKEQNVKLQQANHELVMKATERDFSDSRDEEEEIDDEIDYDEILEEEWL